MAKDESNKSLARSSYEKISRATFGSLRRISHRPKNVNVKNLPPPVTTDTPTVKPIASHIPSVDIHQHVSGETIQIPIPRESFPPPPEVKPYKKLVRFSSSNVKKTGDSSGKELAGQKTFSEEKYNSFIDQTKMKMRAPSNVSGGRTVSRRESFNDMFSSYISRTKMKLRSTSSVGGDGKTASSDR